MVKPRASRAYIMPRASPLITCWRRTSKMLIVGGLRAGAGGACPEFTSDPLLLLGGDPDVLDLAVLPLVDGDGPVRDVAVLVVGDRALNGAQLRGLDRVAEVRAGQGLLGLDGPLHRVADDVD